MAVGWGGWMLLVRPLMLWVLGNVAPPVRNMSRRLVRPLVSVLPLYLHVRLGVVGQARSFPTLSGGGVASSMTESSLDGIKSRRGLLAVRGAA